MLPGGGNPQSQRYYVDNDIQDDDNQQPTFRNAEGRLENQSVDFEHDIDFDNNDIEENENNLQNHNQIPSFQQNRL